MAGKVKTSATSRASTVVLAADPDLQGTIATANSDWLVDVGLRVAVADGHGGIRFNLRLPAGATGFMFRSWKVIDETANGAAVLSIPAAGIGINVGASAADYFMWDNGGAAFSGLIEGTIAFRIAATTGLVALEWAQFRSSAVATTVGVCSAFSARNP